MCSSCAAARRPSRACGRSRAASSVPTRRLDEAAKRELAEETGVDAASLLTQFGAYGDPGRDPRMNVVTVAYLAVLRDVGAIVAGDGCGRRRARPGVRRAQRADASWRSTTCGSCATPSTVSASSSRSRASRRHSWERRSRSPSCGRCTRPSGACSSTQRTSGGASSPKKAGSSRPDAELGPARPAAGPRSSTGQGGRGATAARSIVSSAPRRGREPNESSCDRPVRRPRTSSGSQTSSGRSPRTTRSSSRSTPRRSTGPTAGCAAPSRSSRASSPASSGPKRRILGMELAGEVAAVGAAVSEFRSATRLRRQGLRRARRVHRASRSRPRWRTSRPG